MEQTTHLRKNPSRETCESVIKRILITEVLEKGKNEHFKCAADFMSYFESLYPASDALTKQVQRAIKSLAMPKDENGYFIVNKTIEQYEQEQELKSVFQKAHASFQSLDDCDTIFLSLDASLRSYMLHLLEHAPAFQDKYVTIVESSKGLLIYTRNKSQLLVLLDSLVS